MKKIQEAEKSLLKFKDLINEHNKYTTKDKEHRESTALIVMHQ